MTRYRIGELAKAARVSTRTIDFYTRLGLLEPECRSEGNYRLYPQEALDRLRLIQELKQQHFTLEEIRETLAAAKQADLEATVRQVLELRETLAAALSRASKLQPAIWRLRRGPDGQALERWLQPVITQGLGLAQVLLLLLGGETGSYFFGGDV